MKINRVGKLGEIYTDPESGVMYKCTYTYKDSTGAVDCDWKEIGKSEVKPTFQTKPEIENSHGENSMSGANASEKIPEGKIPEKQIEKQSGNNPRPNKTRYTNYSKK